MHTESEWGERIDAEEEHGAAERYAYFMRPEPRQDLGPIEEVDDPYLGRVKVREMKVGMTRNAKPENKQTVLAYLSPFPHTRIDNAKPLQGWYQSMVNESAQSRPRPCFTEAVLTEPYGGFCLPAGSLVETPTGPVPIERLRPGDRVLGQAGGVIVGTTIKATVNRWCESGLVKVAVGEDQLRLTAEHPVFSLSRNDYVPAGGLYVGETIEARSVQELRAAGEWLERERSPRFLPGLSLPTGKDGGSRGGESRPRFGNVAVCPAELRSALPHPFISTVWALHSGGPEGPRQGSSGKAYGNEGYPEVCGDEGQAVGRPNRQEALAGDQGQMCGASEARDHRAQAVEQGLLRVSQGPVCSYEVVVGEAGGRLLGPPGVGLGLRTRGHSVVGRDDVPAGLPPFRRDVYRGQGVHGAGGSTQDRSGEGGRFDGGGVRRSENGRTGLVVSGIETDPTPLKVYDIETVSANFYVRGRLGINSIHVHNCAVGCAFCYVNSGFRGYRGTGLITVPLDYGAQIAKQLKSMRRAAAGYFSSFTDPFTPLEAYYHNTEEAAREFVAAGLPVFFLSRLRYPEWAVELLTKNPHSYAQKSINTSDPEDWRKLSPGALPLADHLGDIARLKRAGIYVSIQVNPIVPGVTSHGDVYRLFRLLAEAGADHVIVKFVEAGYSWAPAMVERMIKRFGDRGRRFAELFTQNIGSQRTVEEEYRMAGHRLYSKWAERFGLTYSTCYEYKYERDGAGRIISKVGVSVGREFATSSQCHGHAVPVYTRDSGDVTFKPVEECPPSGCLYCAAENDSDPGKPRCGDELAGEANALKLADLRVPIGRGKGRGLVQLGVIPR